MYHFLYSSRVNRESSFNSNKRHFSSKEGFPKITLAFYVMSNTISKSNKKDLGHQSESKSMLSTAKSAIIASLCYNLPLIIRFRKFSPRYHRSCLF